MALAKGVAPGAPANSRGSRCVRDANPDELPGPSCIADGSRVSSSSRQCLGGRKIRVNSVHPGPTDTDMIAFRTPEQRAERMKQVPMHRYGTPEEVAQLMAFLLSDESSYITGAEITIDGAASA